MAKSPAKQPLKVRLAKGVLTISIGVETLKWAAEHHDEFYHPYTDKWSIVINKPNEFAKDVVRALRDEGEDGSTPVHYLLDKAIAEVMENGSEGLDEDAMEALEEAERKERDDE